MNAILILFITIYVLLNLLFSLKIYFITKKFYTPKIIDNFTDETQEEKINVHDKYKEFNRNDTLSFFRIFIGINLFFWIKTILFLITWFVYFIIIKYILFLI